MNNMYDNREAFLGPIACPVGFIYHAEVGDSIYSIARKYGVTPADILRVNNIPNPNLIYPRQAICIPYYV